MALLGNLGFEVAGTGPGGASGWTVQEEGVVSYLAVFNTGTTSTLQDQVESFVQGWGVDGYLMAYTGLLNLIPALFDTAISEGKPVEDFSRGWQGNEMYAWTLSSVEAAPVEDFEVGWGSYDFELPGTVVVSVREDFEAGWSDNESYSWELVGAVSQPRESFESTYQERRVVGLPASGYLQVDGHGLSVGDVVFFRVGGGNAKLPSGLYDEVPFYVVATQGVDELRVAYFEGGAVIPITDTGYGACFLYADPSVYWVLPSA